MTGAARPAVMVAIALLWCYSRIVSGNDHFKERVIQSQRQQQAQRWARWPNSGRPATDTDTKITRYPLPPSLVDALSVARSYEPKRSGVRKESGQDSTSGGGTSVSSSSSSGRIDPRQVEVSRSDGSESSVRPAPRERRPPLLREMPPLLQSALSSVAGIVHVNIIETPAGCNCSGVTAVPNRTLSFLISRLPPLESALLDLYLPIISDPDSSRPAGASSLATQLALCAPGGVGRSVDASLSLKRARHRPQWRHAIIGDHLATLLRPPPAAAAAAAAVAAWAEAGEGQCLQVMLPAEGAVTLDRHGHRSAHLTTRPLRRGEAEMAGMEPERSRSGAEAKPERVFYLA